MTRIFGFENQKAEYLHIPNGVAVVLDNLQEALAKTYEKGWQAYGLGFIVVEKDKVEKFSIFKDYRGLKAGDSVRDNLPPGLHLALSNNPRAVFGVLQNNPDLGEEDFKNDIHGEFPLESKNWYVITMGYWSNDNFSDENLPWYNKTRPSLSIPQYLETNPKKVNFDWIDPRRIPYIVAVRKDGQEVYVVDQYSGSDEKGARYIKHEVEGTIYSQGMRDTEGKQV